MRELRLKLGIVVLTLASAVASAVYVGSHLRNQGAPLHPPVVSISSAASGSGATPVTSTYVS